MSFYKAKYYQYQANLSNPAVLVDIDKSAAGVLCQAPEHLTIPRLSVKTDGMQHRITSVRVSKAIDLLGKQS